tara:strand:+ start:77 stop:430 length:354 start_codon:yes stop_codon:yes gene_type:complete
MPKETNNRQSLIPTQVKWENEGDAIEGVLVHKEMTMYKDQQRGRYLVKAAGGLKVFLGTFQIDQAMVMVETGQYFGVTYLGSEGTTKGNSFKTFDIWLAGQEGSLVDTATGEIGTNA